LAGFRAGGLQSLFLNRQVRQEKKEAAKVAVFILRSLALLASLAVFPDLAIALTIATVWRSKWTAIITLFDFPPPIRKFGLKQALAARPLACRKAGGLSLFQSLAYATCYADRQATRDELSSTRVLVSWPYYRVMGEFVAPAIVAISVCK